MSTRCMGLHKIIVVLVVILSLSHHTFAADTHETSITFTNDNGTLVANGDIAVLVKNSNNQVSMMDLLEKIDLLQTEVVALRSEVSALKTNLTSTDITVSELQAFHPPQFGGESEVAYVDLGAVDTDWAGFAGCFTDSDFVYLVPNSNGQMQGKVIRIAPSLDVNTAMELDLALIHADLVYFYAGWQVESYAYFAPAQNQILAQVDLGAFNTANTIDLSGHASASMLKGFWGGFSNNGYAYYVPYFTGSQYSGSFVRVPHADWTLGAVEVLVLNDDATGVAARTTYRHGDAYTEEGTGTNYAVLFGGTTGSKGITLVNLDTFSNDDVESHSFQADDSTLSDFIGGVVTDVGEAIIIMNFNGGNFETSRRLVYIDLGAGLPFGDACADAVIIDLAQVMESIEQGFVRGFVHERYLYIPAGWSMTNEATSSVVRVNLDDFSQNSAEDSAELWNLSDDRGIPAVFSGGGCAMNDQVFLAGKDLTMMDASGVITSFSI